MTEAERRVAFEVSIVELLQHIVATVWAMPQVGNCRLMTEALANVQTLHNTTADASPAPLSRRDGERAR